MLQSLLNHCKIASCRHVICANIAFLIYCMYGWRFYEVLWIIWLMLMSNLSVFQHQAIKKKSLYTVSFACNIWCCCWGGCVLQASTHQVEAVSFLSLPHPALLSSNPVLFPPHHFLCIVWGALSKHKCGQLVCVQRQKQPGQTTCIA